MFKPSYPKQQTHPKEDDNISASRHYLQSLYEQYKRKSFIPSYELKYQIGNTLQKLSQQRDKVSHQLRQQQLLQATISEQQLTKYYSKKQQLKNNYFTLQVVKKTKIIYELINTRITGQRFKQNQQLRQYMTEQLDSFSRLIKLIEQLDTFITQNIALNKQQNSKQENINTQQFRKKLYKNIFLTVCQDKHKHTTQQQLTKIITIQNWPLKRTMKQKQVINQTIPLNYKTFVQHILHKQACEYALCNFLSSLLVNDQNFLKYNSGFFSIFYKHLNQSIAFLFLQKTQSHNILEPNWMFEYIQESFQVNYQLIKETIVRQLDQESQGSILIYILQYSIQNLFYENIRNRFEKDLVSTDQTKQPFFYFRFIDTLHQLEERLTLTFSQQVSLLQNILLEFQLKKNYPILDQNFDYQHKWIQQKIFNDIYNINYSNIDLKNIEAYNIVTNFNVLFEKLYSKFSKVYDQKLLNKINTFYQSNIRNLAAHIKTSFQRIFNHSGLDKLGVILAFKRVDNEFKSGLSGFISKNLQFQQEIKRQFYDHIISIFNIYSLQQLSSYHRKILKAATECQRYFASEQISQEQYNQALQKSQKVYKNWYKKLEQLNKVYSYKDGKIKNQFFTLLQSVDFTQKGINLFLQFYEPFLKGYFSFQAYNVLKMVILMDKKQQLQYLKVHNNLLNFLLESQLNSIRKFKIN